MFFLERRRRRSTGEVQAPLRAQGQAEIMRMQKTVTGLGSQMRVLVASVRRPADMAALAAQARPQKMKEKKVLHALMQCTCVEEATPYFLKDRAEPLFPTAA